MEISFLRILGLEEQELHADRRRHVVLHRTGHEDDALFQKPRRQIVAALAPRRLLDDHRPEAVLQGVDRISHVASFLEFRLLCRSRPRPIPRLSRP